MAIIGFGLTLSLRLLLTQRSVASSVYLGLYVLILVGIASEIFLKGRWELEVIGATYWAVGPLVYFFAQSKLNNTPLGYRHALYHLTPLFAYLVVLLSKGIPAGIDADFLDLVVYEILFIHILTYFTISVRLLNKNAHTIPRRDIIGKMDYSFSFFLPYASIGLFGVPFCSRTSNLLCL